MSRKLLLLTLFLCVPTVVVVCAGATDVIPAGTLLQCTLDEPDFSSKTALPGDPVLCHLGPLGSFGHSVFPRGAMLGGHLEDYKNPGRFVGKGWIALEFDRMILPGALILPLSTKVISAPHMKVDAQGDIHGKGHPKRDVVEWMIPVLWPIKVLTLPARGPYPTFKGETRISLRLMEDIEVPFPTARSSVPMPPWVSPSSYRSSYGPSSSYEPVRPVSAAPRSQSAMVQPASYSQTPVPQQLSPPAPQQPMTLVVLKGGNAYLAREYWVQGGQIHCVSGDGEQKVFPLETMDLYQTVRVNRERNLDFVLQSRDPVEQ